MAEALLEVVLLNLNSLVQKGLASLWGIGREIEKLSSTLTAIQAVLEDAEEQQLTNHAVKDWLQKLTDAAYVLDDILDECSIKSTRLGIEGESSGSAKKVPTMLSISSFNPKNMSFRYNIMKRITDIKDRLDGIAQEKQKFHLREGIINRGSKVAEWRQTMSIIAEPQVFGRDEDREKIVQFLAWHASNCDDLSVYPIVGTGGVGKTTIAQWVFNDARVKEHFDLKIWIHVSEDFGISTILESIIESPKTQYNQRPNSDASKKELSSSKSFTGVDMDPTPEQSIVQSGSRQNYKTLESMQNVVQTLLQNKRYLLVLDDVWNENPELWERLKYVLLCGLKGSSILLTTRIANTARIMGTVQAHLLSNLSEDHCWSLFRQHAFGPKREEKVELVAMGKEIVKKCGGLPLAAKVLGSLLRFKDEEKEWLSVKESKLWDIQENERFILPALRLSYNNLKLQLKRCFGFCATFPKKEEIMKEQLIHLWMANGFISSTKNLEAEDVGEEVWKELYQRSFFQDVKGDEFGNITSFKMHDLFHDLARHVMGKDCVVTEVESSNISSRSVHHIGCSSSSLPFNVSNLKKIESLRTFFDFNPSYSKSCVLLTFSSLRVLRTSSSDLSSLKNLIHLRYLDLYDCEIKTLPESICSLQKLQILKLESCYSLVSLPKHLTRLQDLRHLFIENSNKLSSISPNIGKLRCLKTLSIFVVGSQRGYRLAELHDLQLGGKLHIDGLENVPSGLDAEEANLIGKKDLRHLDLSWGNNGEAQTTDSQEQVLEALQPHSNLKSLRIAGYKGLHLPNWMINTSILRGLVSIKLNSCRNCHRLPPLGKLPFLVSLGIYRMECVKYIDDDLYDTAVEQAFPSLKNLNLSWLPNLERMLKAEEVDVLPRLSKLCVTGVPKSIFPCLPSIEHLECNQSFPEAILQNPHHLKTMKISRLLKLKVLPTEFSRCDSLEELYITHCDELESFSEQVLQGLSSLRTLRIANCERFRSLSSGVGHLTSLEKLVIYKCPELVALPNDMNRLNSLREVKIWGSDANSKLPEGLERISSLQFLTLSTFPNLASLPECLGDLTSLQKLGINDFPKLRSLPSNIHRLRNLQSIYIDGCPELEKLSKQQTGEEWQKKVIAHVPEINDETADELIDTFERYFIDMIDAGQY